jgi:hypothetical protein
VSEMRRAIPVVLALTLLLTSYPVAGQGMQGPSWDMGWVTDVDPKYVVELEDDWDLTGSLVFFVNNEGLGELNLAITYDYDEDGPFTFDGPESVSVSGNTNETFTINIEGGSAEEVRAFSPSSKIELTVLAEEQVGSSTLRSQEVSADVTVPRMYRLLPDLTPPTETLFAGSWVEFTLEVKNMGNTQDAITLGEATVRSCPHLSVEGLDQLEDSVVPVTNANGDNAAVFTLRLEAASSHQERTCEVSVSVESEGDNNQRSSTMDVAVKAPKVDTSVPDTSDDDEDPSSSSETLSWFSGLDMFATVVMAFLLFLHRRRFDA